VEKVFMPKIRGKRKKELSFFFMKGKVIATKIPEKMKD